LKLRINAGERMICDMETWRKQCVYILSNNIISTSLMHRRLGIRGERHHSCTGHKVTSHMPHTCTYLKQ